MTIPFDCPHCGKHFEVSDQYAGQSGPCQACGQPITVPPIAPGQSVAPDPSVAHGPAVGHPRASSSGGTWVLVILLAAGLGLLGCGGLLVALVLPAVSTTRPAVKRMQCSNNLKQIALALHNYHDTYKTFPPAVIADKDGRPMHSWRALILPFLEQAAVYDQYDFHRPWDSPENQAAVRDVIVGTYCCPTNGSPSTNTSYLLVTGEGTAFPDQDGIRLRDIIDGTSNTIAVVEVQGTSVHWAEPRDIDVEEFLDRVGAQDLSAHPGGFQVALFDGSVRLIPYVTDDATMRNLINPRDGNTVTMP